MKSLFQILLHSLCAKLVIYRIQKGNESSKYDIVKTFRCHSFGSYLRMTESVFGEIILELIINKNANKS